MSRGLPPLRGQRKLLSAMERFDIDPTGMVCADLGSHVGGFARALLQRGACKVYAIDTCAGILDYSLRRDERVIVMERTNALHVRLPEPCDLVTIDVGWTRQAKIIPAALRLTRPGGLIISLLKPQYEAQPWQLDQGLLKPQHRQQIIEKVIKQILTCGTELLDRCESEASGHSGNVELFLLLKAGRRNRG